MQLEKEPVGASTKVSIIMDRHITCVGSALWVPMRNIKWRISSEWMAVRTVFVVGCAVPGKVVQVLQIIRTYVVSLVNLLEHFQFCRRD